MCYESRHDVPSKATPNAATDKRTTEPAIYPPYYERQQTGDSAGKGTFVCAGKAEKQRLNSGTDRFNRSAISV